MSISTNFSDNKLSVDALSNVLEGLRLHAEIYLHSEFCGVWGVDSSGAGKLPFHLISSGQGWLHLPDGSKQALNAGDLVFFPRDSAHVMSGSPENQGRTELIAGDVHARAKDKDNEITSMICGHFALEGQATWPLLDNLPGAILLRLSDTSCYPDARLLMQLMIGELETAAPGHKAVVDQLAKALFVHILRIQIAAEGTASRGLLAALFDPRIGRALNALHNAPAQRWTLPLLAQSAGMSRTALATRFRELVGKTPMRYLTEWRMLRAHEMLSAGEPTAKVAEQLGYSSDASFRQAFRSITGTTPGRVRRGQPSRSST